MLVKKLDRWEGKEKPVNSYDEKKEVKDNVIVNIDLVQGIEPSIYIRHEYFGEYDLRTRNSRIRLEQSELEAIIQAYEEIKKKISNKELIPCKKCSNYSSHEKPYCVSCEMDRFDLWKSHGNDMVKAWGYDPFPEEGL